MTKGTTLAVVIALGTLGATQGPAPQARAPNDSYVVDYYYTARWGYADEFIRLFRKNHYPVLKRRMELGHILEVTGVQPRYHATEDGRWDYRVTIVWKSAAASLEEIAEAELRRLYPDQETFRREEQRRFEILQAHWDVPIRVVNLTQ